MQAIEATGIVINETSIQIDIPVSIRGRIKILILWEEGISKPAQSILKFAGRFNKKDLLLLAKTIEEN